MSLGNFREGIEDVKFRVVGNEQLVPASWTLAVTPATGPQEILTVSASPNTDGLTNNEYEATWSTTDEPLGVATVQTTADDMSSNMGLAVQNLTLISSFGRNFGQAFGEGL